VAPPTLVRYFALDGPVDGDPTVTQPTSTALGALTSGFGQRVLIEAWVVNAAGEIQPPAGLTFDLAVVWLRQIEVDQAPPTIPRVQTAWSRGPIATGKAPGIALTQPELSDVVGFTAVVLAKSASPAGLRLAIYATQGPR